MLERAFIAALEYAFDYVAHAFISREQQIAIKFVECSMLQSRLVYFEPIYTVKIRSNCHLLNQSCTKQKNQLQNNLSFDFHTKCLLLSLTPCCLITEPFIICYRCELLNSVVVIAYRIIAHGFPTLQWWHTLSAPTTRWTFIFDRQFAVTKIRETEHRRCCVHTTLLATFATYFAVYSNVIINQQT